METLQITEALREKRALLPVKDSVLCQTPMSHVGQGAELWGSSTVSRDTCMGAGRKLQRHQCAELQKHTNATFQLSLEGEFWEHLSACKKECCPIHEPLNKANYIFKLKTKR